MVWYCWPGVPWEPNMKEHDIKSVAELRSTTITINDDFYPSINTKRNCLKYTKNCLVKISTWIALNTNNQWSKSNSSGGVLPENCKYYNNSFLPWAGRFCTSEFRSAEDLAFLSFLCLSHLIKKFLNKNSISKRIFDEEY